METLTKTIKWTLLHPEAALTFFSFLLAMIGAAFKALHVTKSYVKALNEFAKAIEQVKAKDVKRVIESVTPLLPKGTQNAINHAVATADPAVPNPSTLQVYLNTTTKEAK